MSTTWRALTATTVLALAGALIVAPSAGAAPAPSAVASAPSAVASAPSAAAPAGSGGATPEPSAAPADDEPTGTAQSAGISEQGDAYMGWSAPDASPAADPATAPAPGAAPGTAPGAAPPAAMYAARVPSGMQALPPLQGVEGIDVSHHNGRLDWQYWRDQGRRFAYVKATEGTHFRDSLFAYMYNGSYNAGLIRGAYHFARPDTSSGAAQAEFFAAHGGAWSADGKTLPGALDIEKNPYGKDSCYGLSQRQMRSWIQSFTTRYRQLTGRNAVIYTSPAWWSSCTGNTAMFARSNPMWIAHWNTSSPRLPAGWNRYTFWQYRVHVYRIVNDAGLRIDLNRFGGDASDLLDFALGNWQGISPPSTRPPLTVGPASLPVATPGARYSAALSATGGSGTYAFRVAGALPAGLHLSPNGRISGTSHLAGRVATLTVGVRDDNGGAGTRTYSFYTTFRDMPKSQLFFGPVAWLSRNKITYGYSDGTFRPAADVSRGAMAAFLYRFMNPDAAPPACTHTPFPDVATSSLFCGHIAWLKGRQITKPADGKYHTSNNVTRGSMTAFLYRLTHPGKPSPGCTTRPFPDVSTSDVFCGYIRWAKDNGIAKGYGDGSYGPDRAVTRGAMAAFLSRIDAQN